MLYVIGKGKHVCNDVNFLYDSRLVIELNANESLMSDNAFDDDADGMETSEDVDENVDGVRIIIESFGLGNLLIIF